MSSNPLSKSKSSVAQGPKLGVLSGVTSVSMSQIPYERGRGDGKDREGGGSEEAWREQRPTPCSPLMDAVITNDLARVEALLAGGEGEEMLGDQGNDLGWTPLHAAARLDHHEIVALLLKRGSPTVAYSRKGDSPLHLAAFRNALRSARMLLESGANVNVGMDRAAFKQHLCVTPLHMAARGNCPEIIRLLLAHGAEVDPRDARVENDGWTPLWYAAQLSHTAAISALLNARASTSSASEFEMDIAVAPKAFYQDRLGRKKECNLASAILHTSKKAKSLKCLDLRDCGLSDRFAPSLPLKRWAATPGLFETVDLTDNPDITRIPLWLKTLADVPGVAIKTVRLEARHMELPLERSLLLHDPQTATQRVLEYASSIEAADTAPVAMPEIKLMVVGRAAVGKTSLVRSLNEKEFLDDSQLLSTDGIDLGRMAIEHDGDFIGFTTWDFGGQSIYRFTHQIFLTDNSIYLVLWNIADPVQTTVREASFWLHSISSRASKPMILLLATHLDRYQPALGEDKPAAEWIALVTSRIARANPAVKISLSTAISSAPGFEDSIRSLKASLYHAAKSRLPRIPVFVSGALLLPEAMHQRLQLASVGPPVVTLKQFEDFLASSNPHYQDPKRRTLLVGCLHLLGAVFLMDASYSDDPDDPASRLVVLHPQWLAQLLATIVTTRHTFIKNGLLFHRDLPQIWADARLYPLHLHRSLHRLLQQLDILFLVRLPDAPSPNDVDLASSTESPRERPFEERCSLVPSLLPHQCPEDLHLLWPDRTPSLALELARSYVLNDTRSRIPLGVLPRILSRVFQFGNVASCWQQGALIELAERDHLDRRILMLTLCSPQAPSTIRMSIRILCTESKALHQRGGASAFEQPLSLEQRIKALSIDSALVSRLARLLHSFGEMVRSLLTEFYHLTFTTFIHCPVSYCSAKLDAAEISLNSLTHAAAAASSSSDSIDISFSSSSSFSCRQKCSLGHQIPFDLLAPDLFLVNDPFFFIPSNRIVASHKIGQGAFGEVWLASLDDSSAVALKMLNSGPGPAAMENDAIVIQEAIKEFQHEIWLMKTLDHPCVVHLLGMTVLRTSAAMVLELVPGGHLHMQLNDPLKYAATFSQVWLDLCVLVGQHDTEASMAAQRGTQPPPPLGKLEELVPEAYQKAVDSIANWKQLGLRAPAEIDACLEEFHEITGTLLGMECRDRLLYKSLEARLGGVISSAQDDALRDCALDWPLRLKLAGDIASGLAYLHALDPPIVHRDLKSPNIFMVLPIQQYVRMHHANTLDMAQPLAKIGDFGLSIQMDAVTSLRVVKGSGSHMDTITPTWAAPEILRGRHYSVASDVYALGIILWELLVRRHPFSSELKSDTFIQGYVLAGNRPNLPETSDPLSARYHKLITACWDANPAHRPDARLVHEAILFLATQPSDVLEVARPALPRVAELLSEHPADQPQSPRAASPVAVPPGNRGISGQITALTSRFQLSSMPLADGSTPPRLPQKQQGLPLPAVATSMLWIADDLLFIGFASGQVGYYDLSRDDPPILMCPPEEAHQQPVSHLAGCFGYLWSCTRSGIMRTWPSHGQSADDVVEVCSRKGWFWKKKHKLTGSTKPQRRWVVLENAYLSWFKHRVVGAPLGSLHVSQITNLQLKKGKLVINYVVKKKKKNSMMLSAADVTGEERELHRAQFEWMTSLVGKVWTMSSDHSLCSWYIDSTADKTGLRPDLRKIAISSRVVLDFIPIGPLSLLDYDLAALVGPKALCTLKLSSAALEIHDALTDRTFVAAITLPDRGRLWCANEGNELSSWPTPQAPRPLQVPAGMGRITQLVSTQDQLLGLTIDGRLFMVNPHDPDSFKMLAFHDDDKPIQMIVASDACDALVLRYEKSLKVTLVRLSMLVEDQKGKE